MIATARLRLAAVRSYGGPAPGAFILFGTGLVLLVFARQRTNAQSRRGPIHWCPFGLTRLTVKSRGAGLFPWDVNISENSFRARFLAGHAPFPDDDERSPYCGVRVLGRVGVNEGHHGLLVGLGPRWAVPAIVCAERCPTSTSINDGGPWGISRLSE